MSLTTAELISDLPALLDFLSSLKDTLEATKGQSPVERDFNILIALLPKVKALAVQIEAQIAS